MILSAHKLTNAAIHPDEPPTKPCNANSALPDKTAKLSGFVCAATRCSVPRFCHQLTASQSTRSALTPQVNLQPTMFGWAASSSIVSESMLIPLATIGKL